jgi:hypothetical protein
VQKEKANYYRNSLFLFVTSSGETSNFLIEDLERVLQLEMIEKYEVSIKLEV